MENLTSIFHIYLIITAMFIHIPLSHCIIFNIFYVFKNYYVCLYV